MRPIAIEVCRESRGGPAPEHRALIWRKTGAKRLYQRPDLRLDHCIAICRVSTVVWAGFTWTGWADIDAAVMSAAAAT